MKLSKIIIAFSLALTLIIFTTNASSAEVCEKIEFAELETFSKKELIDTRCKFHNYVLNVISNVAEMVKNSSVTRPYSLVSGIAASCINEQERIERILRKKYKLVDEDEALLKACDTKQLNIN